MTTALYLALAISAIGQAAGPIREFNLGIRTTLVGWGKGDSVCVWRLQQRKYSVAAIDVETGRDIASRDLNEGEYVMGVGPSGTIHTTSWSTIEFDKPSAHWAPVFGSISGNFQFSLAPSRITFCMPRVTRLYTIEASDAWGACGTGTRFFVASGREQLKIEEFDRTGKSVSSRVVPVKPSIDDASLACDEQGALYLLVSTGREKSASEQSVDLIRVEPNSLKPQKILHAKIPRVPYEIDAVPPTRSLAVKPDGSKLAFMNGDLLKVITLSK